MQRHNNDRKKTKKNRKKNSNDSNEIEVLLSP